MHSAKRQATKEEINKAIEEVGNGNITPGALIGGVGASILGASVTIPAEMLAASAAALVVSAPAIATTMIVVGTAALICGASMILYEYFTHGAGKSRRQEPQINRFGV
jgi:hypothetical protein